MSKVVLDRKTQKALEDQHRRVQSQIETLSPDKRHAVKGLQKLVDHEINEMNELFFSDQMFAADGFLIRNGLPGSCRDELARVIKKTNPGEVFVFMEKSFVKSFDGLVHSTRDYIRSLEMTIADQVEFKEVKYVSYLTKLDKFKLSIKRLFNGRKNG